MLSIAVYLFKAVLMAEKKIIEACPKCGILYNEKEVKALLGTCPGCSWHYKISPAERIAYLADKNSFTEFSGNLHSVNPLGFPGYDEKLSAAQVKTNMDDAIITGKCTVKGKPLILGIMSFEFIGGSMGSVVGEKVTRAFLKGAEEKIPVLLYTTAGGARMQEGIFSLMQMAKTSSAAAVLAEAGIPYFAVLCDPTTGGVTASFAMLANIIMAEPGALIGFAGPRIIESTMRQSLPEHFQRAEYLQDKGFIDTVVKRCEQRDFISKLIDLHNTHPSSLQN